MADKLGITIDFYGNTVDFDKSIDGVNKALKLTKNELSTVNKSLKFETNAETLARQLELLRQKQTLLNESVNLYKKELADFGNYNDLTDDQKKKFEAMSKELGNAKAELAKVNSELAKMDLKNIKDFADDLKKAGDTLDKISDSIEKVGKKFLVLTGAITGLATAGVAYNAELERQTTLFTTLTGSAEEAQEILSAIKQDALGSPFDTQSLITANQYLLATGEEAEKSRQVILDLGNAISATGGGNSELQRMAQNLQQIANVGKATSVDMKQFAMAGIDIWGILADSTGKSVEELQKMDITFDMITEAFATASAEGGKYAGAMEAQADTLNGKISILKATFEELLGSLTETLVPIIKDVIDYLQSWVDKLKNLDEGQKETIAKIALIVASIGPLLIGISKLTSGVGGIFTKVSDFLKNQKVLDFIKKVSEAGGGLKGVIDVLMSTLTKLLNPITLVVAGFALLYASNEDFRNAVNSLVKTLLDILKPAFNIIKGVIEIVTKVVGAIASLIINVVNVAFKGWYEIIKAVIDVIGSLIKMLADSTIGQFFITVIKDILGLIQKLIDGIKKFLELLGIASSSSSSLSGNVVRSYSLADWNSGRIRSGGIGVTTNINVNNNGRPIGQNEIRQWTYEISKNIDKELGRWF